MALFEDPRFRHPAFQLPADIFSAVLRSHLPEPATAPWVHCGYAALESPWPHGGPLGGPRRARALDVRMPVDNGFRLGPVFGFERVHTVVTTGLRSSRFASILFWEVLHILAPGGLWIDIDEAARCEGTPLTDEDYPTREYFRNCLHLDGTQVHGAFLAQTFRKVRATALAARIADEGWSFGILTSGESPRAARMAKSILALDLPRVEVVFCGPRPAGAPIDDRVRSIDLDRQEPRGWITRKKNRLAAAAQYENLCLLHDRFEVTPAWAAALRAYGPCFSFLTFPQVFFADTDRRFPQRYADYQVLYQRRGIAQALETHVYAGSHVLYAAYDDFYDTAFCCGGLYVAKRSLWMQVNQNEALFHCEWEDVSFGLECQRRGLPHRVNPFLTVESLTPHPMALTRIHQMTLPDTPIRGHLHVTAGQAAAAQAGPTRFRPVTTETREGYYRRVITRFNANPHLADADHLALEDVAHCRGIADVWRVVEERIARMSFRNRAELASIAFFLSDTVYNWPNCELLATVRANECARDDLHRLQAFDVVVGWGAGSLFRSTHRALGRELAFVVDSDPARWHTVVDSVPVAPPSALRELDPARTAIVACSCFVDEITVAAQAIGPFRVFSAADLLARRRFAPLADLIAYFDEVERYYPVLFTDAVEDVAA
jgi:hypothetical protein